MAAERASVGRGTQPPADGPVAPRAGVATRAALIAVMAAGSVAMWIGVPLSLVYLVSRLVKTTQPTMGPYLIIVLGVPLGMAIIGKGLGVLDRYYGRRTGTTQERRHAAWLQSMRGERKDVRAGGWKVLDVVMVWSVLTAAVALGVWFFFLAGASI